MYMAIVDGFVRSCCRMTWKSGCESRPRVRGSDSMRVMNCGDPNGELRT
jgi:hypothetical protein